MFKLKTRLKKWIMLGVAALSISFVSILPIKAEETAGGIGGSTAANSSGLLALIAQYTHDTSQTVTQISEYTYQIEEYTSAILTFLNGWILPDTSDSTKNLQAKFTTLTNTTIGNTDTQNTTFSKLMQESLQSVIIPEVNDLTYQSILGGPLPVNPDPRSGADPSYNYIKNTSGLNLKHLVPNDGWEGEEGDKDNYKRFYSTVYAVQSYNAYLLSQTYANINLTQQQNDLMQQASNPDWFVEVATENIGIVLRQILMYNSQTYVLLTQLLQTQREAVAAQAMANTLIILGNQFNEQQLLTKAKTKPKG